MHPVLGLLQALRDDQFSAFRRIGANRPQVGGFLAAERLEHVASRILASRRATNADANPQIVLGSQRLTRAPQAIVAVFSATALQAHSAEIKVQLVMNDDHVLWRNLEKVAQRTNRATRQIHVRARLRQHHLGIANPGLKNVRVGLLVGAEITKMIFRDLIHRHKTNIVARRSILSTGISQANDEERV